MIKSVFEKFISRYNLAGNCESVTYISSNNTLKSRAISDDKNVLVEVTAHNVGLAEGEYSIFDTQKLRSLLGVLGDSITSSVNKNGNIATSIDFTDDNTIITYVLSDKSVIPPVPDMKTLPVFELTLTLDDKFGDAFVKGKSALKDVDTFTIKSSTKQGLIDVILGYSSNNTNRVKIQVKPDAPVVLGAIDFSAKYFKEILVANKDAKTAVLKVSSKGIAKVEFVFDDMNTTYYLVQIKP